MTQSKVNVTWWRRWDQDPPFYARGIDEARILATFPGRQRIMVFCQLMTGTRPIDWQDIEDNGSVMRAREADLIVEMKPAGFVYVLKDRFGFCHKLRSIWRPVHAYPGSDVCENPICTQCAGWEE